MVDTEKEDSVPASTEINKDIITYLWGVHNDLIAPVPISSHVSSTITNLVKEIHSQNLHTKPPSKTAVRFEDLTGPPKVMDEMNARLGQLVSNSIMSQAASYAASKKKFESRLNPLFSGHSFSLAHRLPATPHPQNLPQTPAHSLSKRTHQMPSRTSTTS